LTATSVQTIVDETTTQKEKETIMLLSSSKDESSKDDWITKTNNFLGRDEPVDEDVWLRKRLVDHVESSNHISKQDRVDQMKKFIVNHNNIPFATTCITTKWYYQWNADVPWQQQIGPSCGLTAIRMVRDFYCWPEQSRRRNEDDDNIDDEQQRQQQDQSSLLFVAQERGYTQDGEIFDANHLRELMEDQLVTGGDSIGLGNEMTTPSVRTRVINSLTLEEIDNTLKQGGLWILPYDSNPRTKLAGQFQGKHAHWGILVGILYSERTKAETKTKTTVDATAEDKNVPVMDGTLAKNEERGKGKIHRFDRFPLPLLLPLEEDGQIHISSNTVASDYSSYWCVQHGLASQWSIAPMEDWIKSNQQLISINDQKFALLNGEGDLNLQNRIIQVFPRSNVPKRSFS